MKACPASAKDVATGDYHTCAITTNDQIYCWGENYFGQLGDGFNSQQITPVRVKFKPKRSIELMRQWWRDVSISKKLYIVVGVMACLIIAELLVLRFSMDKLSAVRAFIYGEGIWSKAQKNAVFSLERYGRNGDEKDYEDFLEDLKIIDGDHLARVGLESPHPDLEAVHQSFIQGGLHPSDVRQMTDLIRFFYWEPHIRDRASLLDSGGLARQ